MKKLGTLLLFVMVAVFAFSLAACGDADVVGKWEFYSYESSTDGEKVSFNVDEMTDEQEEMFGDYLEMVLEFKADGTVSGMGGEVGKYEVDGKRIYALDEDGNREEDEDYKLEVKDGKLVMTREDGDDYMKIVFKKK